MTSSLAFYSTAVLERALDGSEEAFARYFFAIYHVRHDEQSGIADYREQLRRDYPGCSIPVGEHFILIGRPAFLALAS